MRTQAQALEARCEYCEEDNERLRAHARQASPSLPFSKWMERRASRMAQLEALNAELERIICDLEEERRRHRETRKFCAQYHGKCAARDKGSTYRHRRHSPVLGCG